MIVEVTAPYVFMRRFFYKKYTFGSWTRPNLSANGSMGGTSFAVSVDNIYDGNYPAWKAVDGNTTTGDNCWASGTNGFPHWYAFYNPDPLKVTQLQIMNRVYTASYANIQNYQIQISDNGSSWTTIYTGTNSNNTSGSTWTINLSSVNYKPSKYFRIYITSRLGNDSYVTIGELKITAQKVTGATNSNSNDYDYIENVPYFLCRKVGGKTVPYVLRAKKSKIVKTFEATGQLQTYVVPGGITSIAIDCVASKGADSEDGNLAGGKGGRVKCNLKVTPGQTLYFMVGKIPTNAGTVSYNASDIRIGGTEYSNRVLVAGGGGSAAWRRGYGAIGGAGGGTTGGTGVQDTTGGGASPGQGGTQSAGGTGGGVNVSGSVWGSPGGDGQLGLGGTSDNHGYHFSIGGVGGAGYYGGGGGAGFHTSGANRASGGGGGSSFANTSYCSSVSHTQGYNNGDGYITIEFTQDITGGGTVVPDPDPEKPEITSITYYCFTADDMYFDINGAPAKYFYLTDLSNGAKGPVYAKRSNGFNPFYFNEDDAAGYGKVTTSPSSGADYGYKITNPTSGDWMEVSFFRSPDNDETVLVTG